MSSINLHSKEFDRSTITKLEIFEDYAQAWIPTFVMVPHYKEIHIFDFFAGPGYDVKNIPGSPIRILKKIIEQKENIIKSNTRIVFHLNEYEPKRKSQNKYELLKTNCERLLACEHDIVQNVKLLFYNKDAEELFFDLVPLMDKYPALVYLDQNGIKFISKEYIQVLESINTLDFLYFISSSHFKRYGSTDEFKRVLELSKEELKSIEYNTIHRFISENITSKLITNSELKIFPFSLKKNSNIYGIVFGSKSYLAVDKFLSIAWSKNRDNGEANFDINQEHEKLQFDMFGEGKMTKIEKFQSDLEIEILNKTLINNKDVLIYTYQNGHIPKHSTEVIKKLKKNKLLLYHTRTPYISYNKVFKEVNIISYKLI
ncbi:MAG: three-Cys-motif partner protein TcmP [Candidatus Kapaibacterium sp.]|nr:three-Cys-motif partner protein TcmP [Ignavibacteriota bacterium]MCB9222250.1 three-Cys-motif partner protein TcmP [Ignavibacteria bacterium]